MKKLLFIILILLSATIARAYTHSEFTSLYQTAQMYNYVDSGGQSTYEYLTGYHDQYNYADPIVRCGREGGTCGYNSTYFQYCEVDQAITKWRVFIPPGSYSSYVVTYVGGQSSQYITVARLGTPITGTYTTSWATGMSSSAYNALPAGGFSQAQLLAGECVGRNAAGILPVLQGNVTVNNVSQGGWLYVITLRRSGDDVIGNVINNYINTTPFMSWYGGTAWDTYEDPDTTVSPSPTPTPTPGPTPTPTATPSPTPTPTPGPTPTPTVTPSTSPVPGCNAINCALQGGACINGVCVNGASPTPMPTPSEVVVLNCNPITCLLQGGHCSGDNCVTGDETFYLVTKKGYYLTTKSGDKLVQ